MNFQPKYKFTARNYSIGLVLVSLFALSAYVEPLTFLAFPALWSYLFLIAVDMVLLASQKKGIAARRHMAQRFSNGDDNPVQLSISNHYPFALALRLIDELPIRLQERDFLLLIKLAPHSHTSRQYSLKPVERGSYPFGNLHIWATTAVGLVMRHYRISQETSVAVYPSFHHLKKAELLSLAEMKNLLGLKRIRQAGQNREFEQVKEFVVGDEIKHINWKASARKNRLMVNQYHDEKSQAVYCVIDMGRTMEMPFQGMSLLDYAINASLALSQVVLKNDDKAGLITYNKKVETWLPADKKQNHLNTMLEVLYKQQTSFDESWLEPIYTLIRKRIHQRSLFIFFVNFESIYSLKRYLPLFMKLKKHHLVLLVNFKNTELERISKLPARNLEEVYRQSIAADFIHEKKTFLQELQRHGLFTLYEAPENISTHSINKYLEIKARGLL